MLAVARPDRFLVGGFEGREQVVVRENPLITTLIGVRSRGIKFFICCIFVCFFVGMASLSSLSGYVWGRLVLKSRETFASLVLFFCGNQFFRRTFPPGIACNGDWLWVRSKEVI